MGCVQRELGWPGSAEWPALALGAAAAQLCDVLPCGHSALVLMIDATIPPPLPPAELSKEIAQGLFEIKMINKNGVVQEDPRCALSCVVQGTAAPRWCACSAA